MSDSSKIWVRSAALDLAITGKVPKGQKRGLPTDSHDDETYIDWGWVYCDCAHISDDAIEVTVTDQDHPHHAQTTKLPGDSIKQGNVLMSNKYGDDDEYYEDDEENGDKYPDDLITLTHLHEPEVVFCLRQRYAFDKIYTSTGPILLALNPFKNCKHLYSEKVMKEYYVHGEQSMLGHDNQPLPPHVYGIADRSFRIMIRTLEEKASAGKRTAKEKSSDQSILVSGESGAGKTVTTKFIMQYLATLSQRSTNTGSTSDLTQSKGKNIEHQVLQSNPILESFGNARTIRNDNSSRFGKFIEIKFSHEGALVGASIETYLLEKVRLISQSEGERNYHIFYELFSMEDELLDKLFMGDHTVEDFRITNKSGTYDRRDGVEDYETYDDLRKAMETMGITEEEQANALTIPCAALHASNIDFIEGDSAEESALDLDNPHLDPFCKLMGITSDALQDALCYLKIQAGREFHSRTLSKEKAQKGMEALIKAFYGALFTFLVKRVNTSITVKDASSRNNRRARGASSANQATIGVLDIFGFESFKHNSFEQLCINYCNEALQQQFNLFVLKNEQSEYDREGIEWSFITFPDNQDVLDLIDKKGSGILAILDDQCRAPGTTDKTFCIDLYKKCTGHNRFEADYRQVGAQKFGVKHYAGPVEYDTKFFVEKNRDELPKEATDLLSSSTKPIVIELAEILRSPTGESAKARSQSPARRGAKSKSTKVTVGGQFSRQLQDLRNKIDLTSPHYVRCLKPNDQLIPDHFNPMIISDQLRYAGVIEAVRVSRVGYPHRYLHKAFVARYRILALVDLKKAQRATRRIKPESTVVKALAPQVWKVQCQQDIANGVEIEGGEDKKSDEPPSLISVGIQIGKTKIFLRRRAYEIIEQLRGGKMAWSAMRIQTCARRYINYRDYRNTLKSIIMVQCLFRVNDAKARVHERRINYRASKLQALWRKGVAHKNYVATLAVAKWMQRMRRGQAGRRNYEKLNRERKAVLLQGQFRRHVIQKKYQQKLSAIVTMQCAVRYRRARKEFRTLKLGAKDLNAAVNERDKLREETRKLKQELKQAKATAQAAVENASSGVSTEELESAKAQNEELLQEVERLKSALKDETVQREKLTERGDTLENECKEKDKELEQQTKRAESYKKRFSDEHEELKRIKKQLEEQPVPDPVNDKLLSEKEEELKAQEVILSEKEAQLKILTGNLSEKETQLKSQEENLTEKETQIKTMEEKLTEIETQVMSLEGDLTGKVAQIKTLEAKLTEKDAVIITQKETAKAAVTVVTADVSRANNDKEPNAAECDELNQIKEQLTTALEEAEAAQREAEDIMNERDELQITLDELQAERDDLQADLDEVLAERDDLQAELDGEAGTSKSVSRSTNVTDASTDELADAYRTIDELERQLEIKGKNSDEDVEQLKLDFQDFRETAERDIEQAEIAIEELTAELEAEREKGLPSRKDLAMMAGDAAAEEILALQDEINCLNKELVEVRKKGGSGSDINSAEMLAKRYEELSRLSIACLEKDKEIERLKKKIEDSERISMPQELQNNEEADHLRHYIHELQKEIDALRQELDAATGYKDSEEPLLPVDDEGSAIGSRLRNFFSGAASLAGRSRQSISEEEPMYESDEADDIIHELEAEVGALREVNEILRENVDRAKKRVKELELELEDERLRSKQELESFAKTLRGVDELRVAAETMHREVKKFKTNPQKAASMRTNFNDEVPEDDLGQSLEEATKIIDSEVERFEERKFDKNNREKSNSSFWGLLQGGKPKEDDLSIPTEEDVQKLMASKSKKQKKKKRRGSSSSVVSSFF